MENVTHSLIGVVIGEAVWRLAKGGERTRKRKRSSRDTATADEGRPTQRFPRTQDPLRSGLLWAAVLGSNLPDFDFLLRPIVQGGNLGYLLHHRGFTHTLLLSPLLALIAAGVGAWIFRRKVPTRAQSVPRGPIPWIPLLAAGWLGVALHVTADFWNDYGVHPFWPLSRQWFYGGVIFILEPLLWCVLLPFAYFNSRTRFARGFCLFLGAAILVAAWSVGLLPFPVAAAVTLTAIVFFMLQRYRRVSIEIPVAGVFLVLGSFTWGALQVREIVRASLPLAEFEHQVVTSPAPGNPLCWRVVVSSTQGDRYRARLGVFSLAPPFLRARWPSLGPERCFARGMSDGRTAPLDPVEAEALRILALSGHVNWLGEFHGSLGQFRKIVETHCRARQLLRFVRVPFWTPAGRSILIGDMRYDREKGLGFAEIEAEEGEPCLKLEPSWVAPGGSLFSDLF
jgi:inner membrane protein